MLEEHLTPSGKFRFYRKFFSTSLGFPEQQMTLSKYAFKEIDGTYYDYLELFLQMGYVTFFSLSFPLAPLLAPINNILEVQVDKSKLIYFKKRPMPMGAENIGIWKSIFSFTSTFGAFITVGILTITDRVFD